MSLSVNIASSPFGSTTALHPLDKSLGFRVVVVARGDPHNALCIEKGLDIACPP